MASDPASDLTGTKVGRYEIRARLGAGGMGEVYCAMDTQLHRQVALKRVGSRYRNEAEYRRHLLNEARRASALNDSRVAAIYDVLEHEQELFVVMEYVDGFTLRERLMDGVLGTAEFMKIARQCVQGLMAAHDKGIVHGDIKPENIMVSRATGEIKLCDFGLARRIPHSDDSETRSATETLETGAIAGGTPAYMAPEVHAGGIVTTGADVFSLGVTFYEMASGINPFRGQNLASTAQRVIAVTPPPLGSGVPANIAAIISRMMEKDQAKRYANARDLLGALEGEAQKSPTAHGWKLLLPAAMLLALAAVVAVILLKSVPIAPQVQGVRNLVILPFETVGSPEQHLESDGLSETLNAALVKLGVGHELQVSPASEVQARHVKNVDDARKELGATLILKGTVQYSEKLVRVNCVLIDGSTSNQLRGDTITVDAGNPFLLQDRIVEVAVNLLGIKLAPVEQASLQEHGTAQPGAYEFYLRGRGYLLDFDRDASLDSAITLFQQALQADRRYGLAYAGLGEAFWRKFEFSKNKDLVEPARMACQSAVSLGSKLAAAHLCLGTVYNGTGEYERAVAELNQSLDLDPSSDIAYSSLGRAYERLGRNADAEKTYRRAIDMKRQYWAAYSALGGYYYRTGKYELAQQMFSQVVRLAPDSYRGYSNLGIAYFAQGRTADARTAFEKSLSIRPYYAAASNLGTLNFYEGDYAGAARAFRQAAASDAHNYVPWGNLGAALNWAGQKKESDAAFQEARKRAEYLFKVNPRDATLLMHLAEYNGALGDEDAALSFLKNALGQAPDDPELFFKATIVYDLYLKRREEALQSLKKAIERNYSWKEINRSPSLAELRKDPRFARLRNSR